MFTGDLGRSIRFFPLPVTELLGRALIWTVGLVGIATLVSFTIGTFLGVMAAWRRGTLFDTAVSIIAIFSSSVPAVVVSLITLFAFGYTLGWFPNGYAADPMLDPAWNWAYIGSVLYHGTLPMLTMVRRAHRRLRGDHAQQHDQPARRGLHRHGPRQGPLRPRRHALVRGPQRAAADRLGARPFRSAPVLGGSLVTEVVFNYPGMGNTLYQAILARDYPVIQGALLIMTAAMLTANFVVDLSYVLLDPRLKRA